MQTKIAHIDSLDSPEAQRSIMEAGAMIRAGGLVVFPTETVYGLGGDATNPSAASRIYEAKGRPSDNPLIIHVADPADAEKYAVTCPLYEKLARELMPGPLTVILPVRETIPQKVTASLPTVAVRCPEHPIARALIRAAGVPIAAPSANLSGSPSPTNGAHVIKDMNGRVDFIIDGGSSEIGLESTIVKIEDDGTLLLLRPGGITVEKLTALGCKVKVAEAVTEGMKEGETVLSPGMKYKHYAPACQVVIVSGNREKAAAYIHRHYAPGDRVLCFAEELPLYAQCNPLSYGLEADVSTLSAGLFDALRQLDNPDVHKVYARCPVGGGVAYAVQNRLKKAAAFQIIDAEAEL